MSMEMGNSRQYLESRESNFWKKKTTLEKILIVVSSVLFVLFIIFVILYATKKGSSASSTSGNEVTYKVCKTKVCNDTAKKLLANMDKYQKPCDDFYQFACGRWIHRHDIEPSKQSISMFSDLDDDIVNDIIKMMEKKNRFDYSDSMNASVMLYNKCKDVDQLNKEGIKPLKDIVTAIFNSTWPLADEHWNISTVKVGSSSNIRPMILANMIRNGFSPMFNMYPGVDIRNTSKRTISVDQLFPSQLGLDRSTLLNTSSTAKEAAKNAADRLAYFKYIETVATIMRGNKNINDIDKFNKDIENMIDFEAQLAQNIIVNATRSDYFNLYKLTTIGKMEKDIGSAGTLLFILKNSVPSGVNVTVNSSIYEPGKPYLKKLMKLVSATDLKVLTNYLIWVVVRGSGMLTTNEFRNAYLQFKKATQGVTKLPPRNQTCAAIANIKFEFAVAGEYAKNYFPKKAKQDLKDMMENVITSFEERVDQISWMDSTTKKRAINKAKNVISFIAYPDWTLNKKKVDQFYDMFLSAVLPNDKLLTSLNKYEQVFNDYIFLLLNQPANRTEWNSISHTTPLDVNANYDPTLNSIRILAGILGGSFYSADRSSSLNYGGIGLVMGHELVHGFDNSGRQFNDVGNLQNWWENKTLDTYNDHTECFVKQYSAIYDTQAKLNLSGEHTLGENIADNGGMKSSFEAYQKWVKKNGEEPRLNGMEEFTPNQLFFLGFANSWCSKTRTPRLRSLIQENEHSPAKYRVNVASSNFKEFAAAFNCKKGTKMNPSNRCTVW